MGEAPDWGVLNAQSVVYPVTDIGELAARLGSIVTHDRRGDVLWLDGFEDGLAAWQTAGAGTGAAVSLSPAKARNGAYSALLVAGSDGNANADITHHTALPSLSLVGVEFSFNRPGTVTNVDLRLLVRDGVNLDTYEVRYNDVNNRIEYMDSGGAFTILASNLDLSAAATLFHTMKLVIDLPGRLYRRLILDGVEYDLTGVLPFRDVSAAAGHIETRIRNNGVAGANSQLYVDDAILTQNEPA